MRIPVECRVLLRILSRMLPDRDRADWIREWESEVWHWWASSPQDIDARIEIWKHCLGAWFDARHLRRQRCPSIFTGPAFALTVILSCIAIVVLLSSGLRNTRRVLRGTDYPSPEQIATVSQPGRLIAREGVPIGKLDAWRKQVVGLQGIEGFWWSTIEVDCGGTRREVLRARVTPGFFTMLGHEPFPLEPETVVMRRSFARRCPSVTIDGRPFRTIGTLPDAFWFIDDRIEIWTILPAERVNSQRMSGAVVRLAPNLDLASVQQEMRRVAWRTGFWSTGKLAEIAPLQPRLRQPIRFYGCAWILMIAVSGIWCLWRDRTRHGAFFVAKFALSITAVVLSILEFTGAAYVGMYGGAVFAGEPGAIWLFVLGSCGAVWFSIADQRLRCRHCLGRLQMPARIGQPGATLFGEAGTELVCWYGHGTLYVDERTENLHETDRWIRLDESWRDLFLERTR